MQRQHKFDHLLGTKHNFLTIRGFAFRENRKGSSHTGQWRAIAVCDCGEERSATPSDIISGRAKTCGKTGCAHFHAIRAANGKKAGFTGYKEIYGCRWAAWRLGAEKRGIPFEISIEEAWNLFEAQGRKCAVTGLPITFGNSWNRKFTASPDRKDSSLPYTKDNIQWVHKRVNLMKSDLSIDELMFWAKAICGHPAVDLKEISVYEREVKGAKSWKKTSRAKGTSPNPT